MALDSGHPLRQQAEKLTGVESRMHMVESLSIKFSNGEKIKFSFAEETVIPRDPSAQIDACLKAPAQVAFWSAQETRALHEVRKQEERVKKTEAGWYMGYRRFHMDETDDFPTERMLRSNIDLNDDVQKERTRLTTLQKQYGMMRAMRQAVEHRCYVLRRLIDHREPST